MMDVQLTENDSRKIKNGIREKYVQVAGSPEGLFAYPTGRKALEILGYPTEVVDLMPDTVADAYCGVGNPFSLGEIRAGERVLDIGCGAGVDLIVAAWMVGPEGRAMGVDLVPEMLARARQNIEQMGLKNVEVREASAEEFDFSDESFDVVISNGVFNLIPDKAGTLVEVFRLLKPGGRLMIADQFFTGILTKDLRSRVETWFQ